MSEGERVALLVHENRCIAARIVELTGWLVSGLTQGPDAATVAGLIEQMNAAVARNQRLIRRLLWQERLGKARSS